MGNKMFIGAAVMVVVIIVLMSVFTVKETEKALRLQLGRIVQSDYEPGLHFKLPLIQNVRTFDARIQTLDAAAEQFLTSEKKNLMVDSYVKWRINNVENYFTATGGNDILAGQRLAELIADGLRSEFGKRTIQEVVSGDRAEIMDIITTEAANRAEQFGIEIVDVRIKQIELPKEVSNSVFNRMRAERERVAKDLRSRGEAEALRIRAQADRERIEVTAKAERDAEQIRGEGDATAADTYAQAFTEDPEFYALYRSLNAYKRTLNSKDDILVLEPDSDFFNFFNQLEGADPAK